MIFNKQITTENTQKQFSIKKACIGTFAAMTVLALPLSARAAEVQANEMLGEKSGEVCEEGTHHTERGCGECTAQNGAPGRRVSFFCIPCG